LLPVEERLRAAALFIRIESSESFRLVNLEYVAVDEAVAGGQPRVVAEVIEPTRHSGISCHMQSVDEAARLTRGKSRPQCPVDEKMARRGRHVKSLSETILRQIAEGNQRVAHQRRDHQ
jgi:hypothetical protein